MKLFEAKNNNKSAHMNSVSEMDVLLACEREKSQGAAAVLSWLVMRWSPLKCLCINII